MSGRKVVVLFITWMSFLSFFACQPLPPSDKLQATPTSFEIPPTFPPPATFDSTEFEIEKRDLSSRLTDLLIGVSANYPQFCDQPERNQIWLLPSNVDEEIVLLADDGIDYNYPQWMPSGNRFLYVESIPVTTTSSETEEGSTGMDSIWMADADGSNRQRVSDYYPRSNHWTPNNSVCLRDTFISGPLIISPDGKYVAFVHKTENPKTFFFNYYLLNINTGETTLLHSRRGFAIPRWDEQSQRFVIIDNGELLVRVFELDSSGDIISSQLRFPAEVSNMRKEHQIRFANTNGLFYSVALDGSTLIGSFFLFSSVSRFYDFLWFLDMDTGEWHKINLELVAMWNGPILGDSVHVACGRDGIYFFDSVDWVELGVYTVDYEPGSDCTDLTITKNQGGKDVISFVRAYDIGDGIWTIDNFRELISAEMYFNIGSFGHNYERILYYSWKP